MTNKILELTEKIYNEGIVKAQTDADKIIADAKKEAAEIIKSAEKKKSETLEQANLEAAELKKNTNKELQLAAQQFLSKLKQQITNLITTEQTEASVKEAFNDIDFIKTIILSLIQNWNPQKPEELNLQILLPEKYKNDFFDFMDKNAIHTLNKELEFSFDTKITNGFKIGPKNGSYIITFSDKNFENYFKEYIKERTKKLLFIEPKS